MGILLDGDVVLSLGEGIGIVHGGRPMGMRGGGVGIFYQRLKMKVVDITPAGLQDEICVSLCSVRGTSRKMVCVGAYLTMALSDEELALFLEKMNDGIQQIKPNILTQ